VDVKAAPPCAIVVPEPLSDERECPLELFGALAQSLLDLTRTGALAVELREMRSAPAIECLPGRRIPLPQRVVGLAVNARDRPPLFDDRPQPVTCGLPLHRVRCQLFGFRRQRLLAGDLCRPVLLPSGLLRLRGFVRPFPDRAEPGGDRIDIT